MFDPARAFAFALSSVLLSAALSRGLGQLASGMVRRRWMSKPWLRGLCERLHAHTFAATVAARLMPVGNFAAINLIAGALAVPWLPFMLGNLVGSALGVAGLTLLADRIRELVRAPTPSNIAIAGAMLLGVIAASIALSKLAARRQRARAAVQRDSPASTRSE